MKTQKGEDFVVEANGHCFFCLTKVTISQYHGVKVEHSALKSNPIPPSQSINSLHCLSKYLKVDMRKVFNEKDYVPPHLLAKVENARLKVELCGGCSHLTESFTKLYRTLEKVEMGMASLANQIQRKLKTADETGKTEQVLNVEEPDFHLANVGLTGKMEIMKALRKEVAQKCTDKLESVHPAVTMQRLTTKQVESKRSKIKLESQKRSTKPSWLQSEATSQSISKPTISIGHPKVEETFSDLYPDDVDDYANDFLDDCEVPDNNKEVVGQTFDAAEQPVTLSSSGMTGQVIVKGRSTKGTAAEQFQCIFIPETGKYKCQLCGKEYGAKSDCKQHFDSIHSMIKYKCTLCGKELSQLSAYRRHLRTVHQGVRFKCQVCSKEFRQTFLLTAHLKLSTSCRTGQGKL